MDSKILSLRPLTREEFCSTIGGAAPPPRDTLEIIYEGGALRQPPLVAPWTFPPGYQIPVYV